MSQNQSHADADAASTPGDGDTTGDRPVLTNNAEHIAVWVNRDKDDNAYLSLKLPLLGRYNVFPTSDQVTSALNTFADALDA